MLLGQINSSMLFQQKIMKIFKILLSVLVLSGCATQKHFDRLIAKDPSLLDKYIANESTVIERDTFRQIDTTVVTYKDSTSAFYKSKDSLVIDTFYHVTEKFSIRIVDAKDTIYVTSIVKPDTIYKEVIVYREKETTTKTVSNYKMWENRIKRNWRILSVISLILILLVSLYKFKKR